MSMDLIDYLPFNYILYIQEILPAWRQALDGDTRGIKKLIEPLTHFSIWPYLNFPEKVSKQEFESLVDYCLGTLKKLYQIQSPGDDDVHFWTLFSPVINALEKGEPPTQTSKFLHACLLYSLCCDLPQEEMDRMQAQDAYYWYNKKDTVFIGNEDAYLWTEYTSADETTQNHWKAFSRPLPPALAQQLLFPAPYHPEEYMHERSYRSLFHYMWGDYACPSSFITWEEAQNLLEKQKKHEAPDLKTIRSGCVRDAEDVVAEEVERIRKRLYFEPEPRKYDRESRVFEELAKDHPQLIKDFQQKYYEALWRMERRIINRVELAVSRGWGMLLAEN